MSGPDTSTATGRVYAAIHAAIAEQRLAPGTRLLEVELAAGFEVSRTVVRQALQRLAQDGVVELRHHHGAQVARPSRERAAQVFDARRVLECEIARRLAGRLDAAALASLQALADDEAAALARGDTAAAVRLSAEFHRALARQAGNALFTRFLDDLLPTTSLMISLYGDPARPSCTVHGHRELLAVLAAGSAAAASAEMRRHLVELERSLSLGRRGALRDLFAPYKEAAP